MTLEEAIAGGPEVLEEFLVEKFGRVLAHGAHFSDYSRAMHVARRLAGLIDEDVDTVIERARSVYESLRRARGGRDGA